MWIFTSRNLPLPSWQIHEANLFFTERPDRMPDMSAPWGPSRQETRRQMYPNGASSLAENEKFQLAGVRRRTTYEPIVVPGPSSPTGRVWACNDDWERVTSPRPCGSPEPRVWDPITPMDPPSAEGPSLWEQAKGAVLSIVACAKQALSWLWG